MPYLRCGICGTMFMHGVVHHCSPVASKPWDMEHVNRVNIPPSEGPLGAVLCPTEGCGFTMWGNGSCPRCGWTLIVTRTEDDSNAKGR